MATATATTNLDSFFQTDNAPASFQTLRAAGKNRFKSAGFPNPGTRDWERWRFTQLRPIVETRFAPGMFDATADIAAHTFGDGAVIELVFVNGHFDARRSKTASLGKARVARLSDVADDARVTKYLGKQADLVRNPFVALNTSQLNDGVLIDLPSNTTIEQPIHLLFVSSGQLTVSHPRVLILAGDNVEAQIAETYAGDGKYFTNAVTEVVLGADCRVEHCKRQTESLDAFHVSTLQASLGSKSQFVSHNITTGGRVTRNDLNCVMNGDAAYATLNGLVLIGGDQHVDNHTLLDHAEPNCPSHELYKHVLSGRSTGVFKGQIYVNQKAQKTDSKQNSKTLLLSDDAQMNSMPALEIYADDVKCTHGSTTGPVDEEQVFYLQSRGLSLDAARHLMTYAFAADVTRRIRCVPVREKIEDFMANQHGLPQDLRINDLGAFDEDVI